MIVPNIKKILEKIDEGEIAKVFETLNQVYEQIPDKATYNRLKKQYTNDKMPLEYDGMLKTFINDLGRKNPNLFTEFKVSKNESQENNQINHNKEKILGLIDSNLDSALEKLDEILGNTNSTYNDLSNQFINRPVGFDLVDFRNRLKAFVRRNL